MNRRPQLALSNHHLKYCQDTKVLYQLKSQDRQLRNIWLISSLMTIHQRRDPNINIINHIHSIKGKTSVNTNKHIKFNKGEYIGCLEPAITDNMTSDQPDAHSTNSVTLQKMMAEQVQLGTFNPPYHKLRPRFKST